MIGFMDGSGEERNFISCFSSFQKIQVDFLVSHVSLVFLSYRLV